MKKLPPRLRDVAGELRAQLVRVTGDPLLRNRCVSASLALRARAAAAGFDVDVVTGAVRRSGAFARTHPWAGHVWCAHGGVYVDLTASQFWTAAAPVHVVAPSSRKYATTARHAGGASVTFALSQARMPDVVLRDLARVGVAVDVADRPSGRVAPAAPEAAHSIAQSLCFGLVDAEVRCAPSTVNAAIVPAVIRP